MSDADLDDDPLWLRSPFKRSLLRGSVQLLPVLGVGALGRLSSGSWWGALFAALLAAGLVAVAGGHIERALGRLARSLREQGWREREGRHFSINGVSLQVHDDGRRVWLHETGLRRLLGLRGTGLWLDAAAVHRFIGQAPGRLDPPRLRLRSFIDREILQPAERRRGR